MRSIEKPKDGEFPPYANMYIELLPDDGLLIKHLKDNFIAIKTGKPVLISYDQFMQKYRNIFVDGRSKALPAPAFTPPPCILGHP